MIFLGIAAAIFLLDWVLKKRAEERLREDTVREVACGTLLLRRLHNRGVALGMFKEHPRATLYATAVMVTALLAALLRELRRGGSVMAKLGCALMAGGGLSNLWDRRTKGYVTDYFSFNVRWRKLRRLVFNVSDLFIFFGSILLCLGKMRKGK